MIKGELFETVVRLIQEALKDSKNTFIKQNFKLIDQTGLSREFDVIIESMISGTKITIAIECKDYQRKISLEKIEAFQSKCNNISNINKKIFVSRSGFQSGAIAKADYYGIDLLVLEEINESQILIWLGGLNPSAIQTMEIIKNLKVLFRDKTCEINDKTTLVLEPDDIKISLENFLRLIVQEEKLKVRNLVQEIETDKTSSITLRKNLSNTFVISENTKYEITYLEFDIERKIQTIRSDVSKDRLFDVKSNNEISQSTTISIKDNDVISFIKKEGEEDIEIIRRIKNGSKESIFRIGNIKIEKAKK